MTDRPTAATITDDELDTLYARIETLEHVAAGNKRHVQLIVPELEAAQADLARYEEVLGELNETLVRRAKQLGEAEAALARVRALHRAAECANVRCKQGQWCIGCDPHGLKDDCSEHPWPCPTITAIDGEQTAPAPATTQATGSAPWLLAGTRDHRIPEQHTDPARTALAEILDRLHEITRWGGNPAGYQTVNPIPPATYARWQAALNPPTPTPHTGLVVQPYRNDAGQHVWVFRCWGTDTCDGWLSLDHYSRQSAERARDRHVAEDHPATPGPCPACQRADQAGLAPAEQHDDCAKEQH